VQIVIVLSSSNRYITTVMKLIVIFSTILTVSSAHAWSPGVSANIAETDLEVNGQSRNDVISFYQNVYHASEDYASKIQWSGNVTNCNAGTISAEFVKDVRRRVNYYRALAGVPAEIVMNDPSSTVLTNSKHYTGSNIPDSITKKSEAAQKSALIVAKMNSLTHHPDATNNSICFSAQGANGSEFGNIAVGLYGPAAIDGYIKEDIDNQAAGHRRWIFYDKSTHFATGDIPPTTGFRASNSLYVFQRDEELSEQTPQFVAWPYKGMFPRQHMTEYWSLCYPDADFANATISVTKNGNSIAVDQINRSEGYGHNSIVWRVPSILQEKLTDPDTTYQVTVSNIGGGGPSSFTYDITFFNANNLATPPTLTGSNTVAPGGTKNYSIGKIEIAEEYQLEVGKKTAFAATVVEGAENATQTMILPGPVTTKPEEARSNLLKRTGLYSLNIKFTRSVQAEEWIEFNRVFYPRSAAKINYYRALIANAKTTFVAQYSINDDGQWRDIPGSSVAGTLPDGTTNISAPPFSSLLSYALPAETIGKPTRIRLLIRKNGDPGTTAFIGDGTGAFIDDVTFTNMDWLSGRKTTKFAESSSSVPLNFTTAGEALVAGSTYTLRIQPRVGSIWMTSSTPLEVTVNSNMAPTIDALTGPITIAEDADTQTVNLSGITAGEEETQPVTITATSSNPALIPNPTVAYTNPSETGQLSFRPNPNLSGTATISVRVSDGQASNGITIRTFDVIVQPVNDVPTIPPIANRVVNEDLSTGAIAFTIRDIDSPLAALQVSATSSNPDLVPNIAMTLAGTTASRSITIRPVANRWGSATITLTITDGGASSTTSFLLTVNPVNDLPTLNVITNRIIPEDSAEQTVELTGISAGPGESEQTLTITATSSNQAIIATPVLNYSSGDDHATLTFTPRPDAFGLVTITVTLRDGQATANTLIRTFTVNVTAVNDSPTISLINDLSINEDTRSAPLALTVFDRETAGGSLRINKISSNPTLIPLTGIVLVGTGNNRTITIAPALNQSGSALVTIQVSDGLITVSSSFTVTVESVNDAPTLATIANPVAINEDAPAQTRSLSGIGTGATNENDQTLTITATSSNPNLIPHPTVIYQSPSATGSLIYTPVANAFGSATITVTVNDNGPSNNTVSRTFLVSVKAVNDLPTISSIQPINLTQNTSSGPIGFVIGDLETPPTNLSVTAASNNTTLLPLTGIILSGTTAERNITITPVANRTGTAVVTLTVSDGAATARTTISITVSAPIAPSSMFIQSLSINSLASTNEGEDGLPYCIEYQPSSVAISYLAATKISYDDQTQTIRIDLPNSEISNQSCYRAEYSDDGESWFTDGVVQEKTTDGLTATAPRGDAENRLMRWKVTTAQP